MGSVVKQNSNDYWRYAIFAAPLAAVGIPIYIYAPKFLVDHYGLSLWHVGAMFLFLRLIDVIQDPFLGKIAQKIGKYRRNSVLIFIVMLCFSVWFFFAVDPLFEPLVYSGLCLLIMFTAFSYLNSVHPSPLLVYELDGHLLVQHHLYKSYLSRQKMILVKPLSFRGLYDCDRVIVPRGESITTERLLLYCFIALPVLSRPLHISILYSQHCRQNNLLMALGIYRWILNSALND